MYFCVLVTCNVKEVCSKYADEVAFMGKDCKCYCPGNPVRLCSEPKRGKHDIMFERSLYRRLIHQSGHLCIRMEVSSMHLHGNHILRENCQFWFSFHCLPKCSLISFISIGIQGQLSFLSVTLLLIDIFTIWKKILGAQKGLYKLIFLLHDFFRVYLGIFF